MPKYQFVKDLLNLQLIEQFYLTTFKDEGDPQDSSISCLKIHLCEIHSLDKLHQEEEEMDLQKVTIWMIMNLAGILKEVNKDHQEEDHLTDPQEEEILTTTHTMQDQPLTLTQLELPDLSDQLQSILTLNLRMILFLSGTELLET